ncbi:MAG: nucleoside triphosphate pyrophosphatase [Planctomycetota bacterium]
MGQVVHPLSPTPVRPALILASASPRRLALLGAVGWVVQVRPAEIDETIRPGESPSDLVLRLARSKARRSRAHSSELVLAADTVVFDPEIAPAILGKPANADDARVMLGRLAGREHRVITGYCVIRGERERVGVVTSRVRMRPLASEEIGAYVASGEPLDKAGAYGIQGLGAALVEQVLGSYSNVVGLPMREVLASIDAVAAS